MGKVTTITEYHASRSHTTCVRFIPAPISPERYGVMSSPLSTKCPPGCRHAARVTRHVHALVRRHNENSHARSSPVTARNTLVKLLRYHVMGASGLPVPVTRLAARHQPNWWHGLPGGWRHITVFPFRHHYGILPRATRAHHEPVVNGRFRQCQGQEW